MNLQSTQDKLDRHLSFLQQDEHNLNLLLEVSNLYSELNDLDKVQVYLNKAKVINPEASLAPQGVLALKQGNIQEAKKYFQEALLHNNSADLHYNLGFTYYLNNELDQALSILYSIKDPESLNSTQLLIARILHQQNQLEQAISLLEEQVKQYPDEVETLGFLSLLYFDVNNEALAHEFSQRALELSPDLYDAQLVELMLRLLHQETNIEEVKKLLEINPEDSRLWFALGSTYMSQGDFSSAEDHLQSTLKIHPEFYDCYIALAWCQLLNDKLNEAHETYQNAISTVDNLADGWGGLAIIYALNADLEKTEQLINKAQSLNPECFLTQIAQTIYLTYKNPQEAQQHLFTMLTNQRLSVSEKIALVINELQ